MNLGLNFYTQWYWKIDLHNLMHFLDLRGDAHAQHEIRVYARAMREILKRWVPITCEAFVQHRLEGVHLSKGAWGVIRRMVRGESVDEASSGLGKREWSELQALLGSSD
jgi:thymidylate synthase (FAD)